MEPESLTEQYLNSLTEKERMAYEIAKDHLGSSFELEKSNGFIAWTAKQSAKQSAKQTAKQTAKQSAKQTNSTPS